MNLLTDNWIPVRSLAGGGTKKITLRELLCGNVKWELCLSRDDMELAALQLLVCVTQALITPKTTGELKSHIIKPLPKSEYDKLIQPFSDWFQLDHPKTPFMQVHGVSAKITTPMEKLFAGITGSENCCFVNEPDLVARLCGGCAAIALFNQASCTPGFGGGFKDPLRSGTPITTFVQGSHLRQTVWLNVLYEEKIERIMPWHQTTKDQEPTWKEPVPTGTIQSENIGFIRGLFWQPAHIELLPPVETDSCCSFCGFPTDRFYTGFLKAKFSNYKIIGIWPHPHSPRVLELKRDGVIEQWFPSFSSMTPAWSQLNRFVVQQAPQDRIEGYEPAAVVIQSKKLYGQLAQKLHLVVGGYGRRKASIVRRCHEVFTLGSGWHEHPDIIQEIVGLGTKYKEALTGALFLFFKGLKDQQSKKTALKGLGGKLELHKLAAVQFYRLSEQDILDTLACINFSEPCPALLQLGHNLEKICRKLFEESVRPYLNDPELIRTLAAARKKLGRNLVNLKPQQDKGGSNGTVETP